MSTDQNLVPWDPPGLTIALQYYAGDEAEALRLARLIADIEPERRDDVTLLFCRRFDAPLTLAAWETIVHCGHKFPCSYLRSEREGTGHPDGCNGLWAGTLEHLATQWQAGNVRRPSVFFIEADGVPLRKTWLADLIAEQEAALVAGKRITGALTRSPFAHINGSLIAHLSIWPDRPSLHQTPPGHAWDVHHAAALLQETRPTPIIKNVYGAKQMSAETLRALGRETAWLANVKDSSAADWARRTLVA